MNERDMPEQNEQPTWQAGLPVRPRLYLDIDGSICPYRPDDFQRPAEPQDWWWTPPTDDWPEWVDPQAFNETPFPVELLDDLATCDWLEVVWATTWPLDMIEHAMETAGYPSLRFRHLDPGGLSGKFEAIKADVERTPTPFVWVEDHWFAAENDWQSPVSYRRVRPEPTVAITRSTWKRALTWLRSQAEGEIDFGRRLPREFVVAIESATQDDAVFEILQPNGAVATLDFRSGGMGDLCINVEVNGLRGFLQAYHSAEVEFLVAVCRQWMSRASDIVLAEIDAVRRWLKAATTDRTATTESQHDLMTDPSWRGAMADGFARPAYSECHDEHGWPIEIEPSSDGLSLTRPDDPDVGGATEVFVANEHLHLLVAGLMWRTYGEGSNTFTLITRQNTAGYIDALDQFERIVRHRI